MDVNFKSVIFGFLLVAGEWLAPLKRHAVRRILNRNIRLRSYNFRILVLVIAGVDGCTRLEATSSAQSFDSHSNYPFQDYDRYNQRIKLHNHEFQDKTWIRFAQLRGQVLDHQCAKQPPGGAVVARSTRPRDMLRLSASLLWRQLYVKPLLT